MVMMVMFMGWVVLRLQDYLSLSFSARTCTHAHTSPPDIGLHCDWHDRNNKNESTSQDGAERDILEKGGLAPLQPFVYAVNRKPAS